MFVRLNSDDVLLIHIKGWMKWFNELVFVRIVMTLSLMD